MIDQVFDSSYFLGEYNILISFFLFLISNNIQFLSKVLDIRLIAFHNFDFICKILNFLISSNYPLKAACLQLGVVLRVGQCEVEILKRIAGVYG